jgi:hypothetical protein
MSNLEVEEIVNDSDYYSDEVDTVKLNKKDLKELCKMIKDDNPDSETFGWDGGNDLKVFAQQAIKRFRLKKLKSFNDDAYYFDKVTYYIWQLDSQTGIEKLVRPTEEVYIKLRSLNEIQYEPFLPQPDELW